MHSAQPLFRVQKLQLIGLVHGDDFMVVGPEESLEKFDKILNDKYTARKEALLGPDSKDQKEAFFLNRLIRYVPDGADQGGLRVEVEADARHAEILFKTLDFNEKTKVSEIPETKLTEKDILWEEKQPTLDKQQASLFRSMTMRIAYLSQDRPDLCHSVRSLASAMREPRVGDWQRLKKVVRYLVGRPFMKRVFHEQIVDQIQVRCLSDSDWAGNMKTRRSVSGVVLKINDHPVLVKSTSQKVVALSSAEAEYYGMCRTATCAEFVRGVLEFWLEKVGRTEMMVDSTSAKAMAERRGVGKSRHVQARFLWLQHHVQEEKLKIKKVAGPKNDADLTTKVQTRKVIDEHLERMHFVASSRSGHKKITI